MIANAAKTSPLTATDPQRKSVWPESFLRGSREFVDETGVADRRALLMTIYFTRSSGFVELQKTVYFRKN
jgi:hypothetical protein